jgi:uncharacterized membrane protein YphA (DoxX/SURF4 family)
MKIAVIVVRVLMGLMFAFASIVVLFKLMPQPEQTGNVKIFMDGMTVTGYMMTTIKLVELICAIAFLSGRFVPLATVVIFPITINILLFHAFLEPSGLPVAILLILGNLFLAWNYREKYKGILASK